MAWEWSHSAEGLDYARNYLAENMLQPELVVIAAEWATYEHSQADEDAPEFDQEFYDGRLKFYDKLPVDVLAEAIWEKMEQLRTCDNGGAKLWACPYGCAGHKIPVGEE